MPIVFFCTACPAALPPTLWLADVRLHLVPCGVTTAMEDVLGVETGGPIGEKRREVLVSFGDSDERGPFKLLDDWGEEWGRGDVSRWAKGS